MEDFKKGEDQATNILELDGCNLLSKVIHFRWLPDGSEQSKSANVKQWGPREQRQGRSHVVVVVVVVIVVIVVFVIVEGKKIALIVSGSSSSGGDVAGGAGGGGGGGGGNNDGGGVFSVYLRKLRSPRAPTFLPTVIRIL
ncbi:hypothetical protein M0802_006879 [Mischocyttarus mexicanus]|nr:hypothetical protein M0802_006879 [Mischocyttarus mexicanus]